MEPLQRGDPTTIGRYRLGGRLGFGGMGRVYWARSASGRPVAVKVVHPHLADEPGFRARFAHEVDAARRVGGFHTAPVVDADPTGDPPWLVTAYVAGPALADAVRRAGPFDLPALRVLGAGLAEALEAVHAAGLVHRDLKPANILLTDDGPRVIDFGIARALDPAEAQHLTATGASIGTPRFMAPEQFGNEPVTGATDVFAWGSVMCFAAGVHPYGEGSAATLVGAILTRPPRLDGLPRPLLEVVTAALEKDPARRPTPAQLLDTLADGRSSDGWLPPTVQAMLPEHTLPDVTGQIGSTDATLTDVGDRATDVIDCGPTARVAPPGSAPHRPAPPAPTNIRPSQARNTRELDASPADPVAAPPRPAHRRNRGLMIGVAVAALVVVAIIVGIGLSGQRTAATAGAAPTTTAEATTAAPTVTPSASEPRRFIGDWRTVVGSTRTAVVTIDVLPDGSGAYGLWGSVGPAPECGSGNYFANGTGSPSDNVLAMSLALTCVNDSSRTASIDLQLTYEPATDRLRDSMGNAYTRD